jgi:hypothetical protein
MSSDSPAPNPSIICPRCGTRSFHPKDIEHGYCGSCHDFTHGGIDGAESLEIWVNGIVAVRDNRPYVQLSTTKGIVAQLTISQVRKVATDMMTIAYRTEMDAMFVAFLKQKVGAPPEVASEAMVLFREYRHELDMERAEGRESQ